MESNFLGLFAKNIIYKSNTRQTWMIWPNDLAKVPKNDHLKILYRMVGQFACKNR